MANNESSVTHKTIRYITTSGHGQMSKQQAKELKDKWNAKIYGTGDSDNGDNASQSVTPP